MLPVTIFIIFVIKNKKRLIQNEVPVFYLLRTVPFLFYSRSLTKDIISKRTT